MTCRTTFILEEYTMHFLYKLYRLKHREVMLDARWTEDIQQCFQTPGFEGLQNCKVSGTCFLKGNREIEVEASASSLAELWVLLEGEFVLDIDINVENERGSVLRVEMHPHDEAVKVTVYRSSVGEKINSNLASCFPDHREFVDEKEFLIHYVSSSGITYAELMELKHMGILGDQA